MKIRFCAALLLAVLAIPVLTGCASAAGQQLDAAENRLDAAGDVIESQVEAVFTDAPVPLAPAPAAATTPAETTALLTKEEAIAIALKDVGLEESQVTRLRAELDYDRGRPEYDVDFHVDRWEYDYEIDAETGKILDFDKDWDD